MSPLWSYKVIFEHSLQGTLLRSCSAALRSNSSVLMWKARVRARLLNKILQFQVLSFFSGFTVIIQMLSKTPKSISISRLTALKK